LNTIMTSERWEDVTPIWRDPGYGDRIVPFHGSVRRRRVAGSIITCAEPVDWSGHGGKDLLLSAWDACYGAKVRLLRQTGMSRDGTPGLKDDGVLAGLNGFITVVPDRKTFHLLSTSRLRRSLDLYVNVGQPGHPRFEQPIRLDLDADWLHGGEVFHLARFHDIDGDGRSELILGTDYWQDYWPDGKEWNVEGYDPYDSDERPSLCLPQRRDPARAESVSRQGADDRRWPGRGLWATWADFRGFSRHGWRRPDLR
jgi:hypothetical protein